MCLFAQIKTAALLRPFFSYQLNAPIVTAAIIPKDTTIAVSDKTCRMRVMIPPEVPAGTKDIS